MKAVVWHGKHDMRTEHVLRKGIQVRSGQTHVHRYLQPLLEKISAGDIDPSEIITHRTTLDGVPAMYETFAEHDDGCEKVVISCAPAA